MSATKNTEPMSSDEYVKCGGVRCPYCNSQNLEGGQIDVDAGGASQHISCGDCDKQWWDVYTLVSFEAAGE